jgi:hypothetical protein
MPTAVCVAIRFTLPTIAAALSSGTLSWSVPRLDRVIRFSFSTSTLFVDGRGCEAGAGNVDGSGSVPVRVVGEPVGEDDFVEAMETTRGSCA